MRPEFHRNVFINAPFDPRHTAMFQAIVFAVYDCGFVVRCALEQEDASQVRIEKIYQIISDCGLGIHDISLTTLDRTTRLPRFNMPLELGLFLGCKRFGGPRQQQKNCLILDTERTATKNSFLISPARISRPTAISRLWP